MAQGGPGFSYFELELYTEVEQAKPPGFGGVPDVRFGPPQVTQRDLDDIGPLLPQGKQVTSSSKRPTPTSSSTVVTKTAPSTSSVRARASVAGQAISASSASITVVDASASSSSSASSTATRAQDVPRRAPSIKQALKMEDDLEHSGEMLLMLELFADDIGL